MGLHRRTLLIGILLAVSFAIGVVILFMAIPKMGYCFGISFSPEGDRLYVAAGYRGLHSFRVTDEGELEHISLVKDGGYCRYVEVAEDVIHVANSRTGLMVYALEGDTPVLVWTESGSKAYGIHLHGGLAFVAAERDGLVIFDVTDPRKPVRIGHADYDGRAWDVWADGGIAFVADPDRGLLIFNVSKPSEPTLVSSLTWDPDDPSAEILEGSREVVYVASGKHGLLAINVSDPVEPAMVWRYDPGLDTYGESVRVSEDALFATMVDDAHPGENGLHIFEIGDPFEPVLIGKLPIRDWVEDIALFNGRIAIANTHSGVLLFHAENGGMPRLLDTYPSTLWRFLTRTLRG